MKTKRTEVNCTLAIWAIPNSYKDEEGTLPFDYKVKLGNETPWQDGSVKITESEQIVYVPAGIDLLEKAIETLKGEIQKTRADAQKTVEKYEKQMESLLQLTYDGVKDDMTGLDPREVG